MTMPSELFKRIDLDLLYAPFRDELLEVIAECRDKSVVYVATSGFRDADEQNALYAQGRSVAGAVVTQARAGESAHNFGLAVDFARKVNDSISWEPAAYAELGDVAKAHGLAWGGDFRRPDLAHVQLKGYETKEDLAPLRAIVQRPAEPDLEWLGRVWSEIEKRRTDAAPA